MPAPDPEIDGAALQTLVAAQAANRASLTAQATALAVQAARSFRHWYESDAITEWADRLASRIEALQRNQAQTTDAYLARAASQIAGKRIRPLGRVEVTALRTGVTHAGAYARAADVYRWRQSQIDAFARKLVVADLRDGVPMLGDVPLTLPALQDPGEAAAQRVAAVADIDIQLADRAQSKRFLTDQQEPLGITGQRRVIHPELSKGGTCGLCIAASDRIYGVHELRPIHRRCECTTLPVTEDRDPGSGLNGIDLRKLYRDAGNTTDGHKLKRTRYQINEHGELGPVLTAKQPFRTARDARRDTRPTGSPKARSRESLQRTLTLEQSAQQKAHDLAKSDPKQWGGYAASLDARVADLQAQLAA